MNATGTNTATMENVVAVTARPISAVPLRAAVMRSSPRSMCLHYVFAHHDGVVDEHADGQRQAEQRHEVQREAAQPHGDERGDGRGRQRQAGDQRRTPGIQERVHDEDREAGAEDQRVRSRC